MKDSRRPQEAVQPPFISCCACASASSGTFSDSIDTNWPLKDLSLLQLLSWLWPAACHRVPPFPEPLSLRVSDNAETYLQVRRSAVCRRSIGTLVDRLLSASGPASRCSRNQKKKNIQKKLVWLLLMRITVKTCSGHARPFCKRQKHGC